MVGLATKKRRPNLHFDLIDPATSINYGCPPMGWRYDPTTMARLINENRILWPPRRSGRPRRKKFLAELKTTRTGFSSIVGEGLYTRDGTAEIVSIFGEPIFAFPKPVQLLIELFEQGSDEDSIILDCCAGSGTTAHAVLSLNHSESSNRKFIVIQQPFDNRDQEKQSLNVCRQITRNRIEAVAEGYIDKSPGSTEPEHFAGIGGAFTYALVGDPLFGEYKDFGDDLPTYEDIAKYVFYTETSREFPGTTKKQNPAWDKQAGRIGEHAGRSYYLLYEPNEREDRGLDRAFLKDVASRDPNRELVVYCERLAVHQDELRKFDREHGKKIRHMLVPFNLK